MPKASVPLRAPIVLLGITRPNLALAQTRVATVAEGARRVSKQLRCEDRSALKYVMRRVRPAALWAAWLSALWLPLCAAAQALPGVAVVMDAGDALVGRVVQIEPGVHIALQVDGQAGVLLSVNLADPGTVLGAAFTGPFYASPDCSGTPHLQAKSAVASIPPGSLFALVPAGDLYALDGATETSGFTYQSVFDGTSCVVSSGMFSRAFPTTLVRSGFHGMDFIGP